MKFAKVIAALSAVNGALAVYVDEAFKVDWHKDHVGIVQKGVLLSEKYDALAVQSELSVIGVINTTDGDLIWRRQLSKVQDISAVDSTLVAVSSDESTGGAAHDHNGGAVIDKTRLTSWNPITGALIWEARLEGFPAAAGVVSGNVYACTGDSVYKFDAVGNQLWSEKLSGSKAVLDLGDGIVGIVTAQQGKSLSVAVIKGEGISTTKTIDNGGAEFVQASGNFVLSRKKGGVYSVASISSSGAVASTGEKTASGSAVAPGVHMRVSNDAVTLVGGSSATVVYNREPNGQKLSKNAQAEQPETHPDEEFSQKAIISFEKPNGEGVIYQGTNGRLVNKQSSSGDGWVREEGLANAVGAVFIDLPELDTTLSEEELLFEEHANVVSAFTRLVTRHLNDLKYLPDYLKSKFSLTANSELSLFGFRKLLVIVSRHNRIVAFDTSNGQVEWGLDYPLDSAFQVTTNSAQNILVFGKSGQVLKIDGLTGVVIEEINIGSSVDKLLIDYKKDDESQSQSVGVYSTDKGIIAIDGEFNGSENHYFITNDKETVYGHHGGAPTWSFSPGGEIVAVAQRDQQDITASLGTILGDRRVLYKYLHPNSVAVAALNSEKKTLSVYLIDTVTGRILHSKLHEEKVVVDDDNNTPVSLVFGEHWIVYSYYSEEPTFSSKIVVWDLYESEEPNQRWTAESYSSFDPFPLPHVKAQSYFLPSPVESIAITRTKFGITSRDILVSLEDGQIMSIPKRLLDARRPMRQPTKEEAEEGLIKYEPMIGKEPRSVLTHSRQVFVNEMITVPASLESTSMIAGYGLDIFFTRVTPSMPFDILNSNFGKQKLLYTIAALIVLVNVLRPMVSRRAVNRKWT